MSRSISSLCSTEDLYPVIMDEGLSIDVVLPRMEYNDALEFFRGVYMIELRGRLSVWQRLRRLL